MGTLDSSMEERVSIWNAGMTLFKQNPFWGEGPLTYMHSYPRIFAPYHEHAHSIYIDYDIELRCGRNGIVRNSFFWSKFEC